MNKVITIGREFGSGGRELGRLLAEELGCKYYDKQILNDIVKETSYSHKYVSSVVEGSSKIYPVTLQYTSYVASNYTISQMQEIFRAQTEVIKKMAAESSCVIVGRCADYILNYMEEEKDFELFRLFVYADMESRIRRCQERAAAGENLTDKEMKKAIKNVDRNRANYYEDYTLQRWGDKANYDICINTTNMDIPSMVPYLAKLF